MPPDPRPLGRLQDPELLAELHRRWRVCALGEALHPDSAFGPPGLSMRLSLHHIIKQPRRDEEGGLVMLCGDGTTGCHFLVEQHDQRAMLALQRVLSERVDVWEFLVRMHDGDPDRAADWLARLPPSPRPGSVPAS